MSENETKQPSAGEVLKNIRAWALSETSQRYFQNLSSNPDGAGERFLAEHPTFAHWATSRMVCALLGELHGPEGYALTAPQPMLEREAARLATIPPEIAAVILAIGPAQWGVSVGQTASEHGEMMTRSVRLTAEHFGQGDEPQPMQMLLREGTDTVIAYVGTSPHSAQAARGMTAAWNYLHRDCQALATGGEAQ